MAHGEKRKNWKKGGHHSSKERRSSRGKSGAEKASAKRKVPVIPEPHHKTKDSGEPRFARTGSDIQLTNSQPNTVNEEKKESGIFQRPTQLMGRGEKEDVNREAKYQFDDNERRKSVLKRVREGLYTRKVCA